MPLVTAAAKRVFFAHVPKTGGSSVEDYLVRRFGGPLSLRDVTNRRRDRHRGMIALSTHFTARDLDDVLPHDIDHAFALVREPLSRMKSQFRFQTGISRTRRFDFATWVRIMFAAHDLDPRVYQNHIRPQSDLVREGMEVFRLEDGFDGMIAWLDEITGTTAPDVEMGHLLKKPRAPIAVSREDAEAIAEFYAVDHARFGYARPDVSALPSRPFPAWKRPVVLAAARAVVARQHRLWLS